MQSYHKTQLAPHAIPSLRLRCVIHPACIPHTTVAAEDRPQDSVDFADVENTALSVRRQHVGRLCGRRLWRHHSTVLTTTAQSWEPILEGTLRASRRDKTGIIVCARPQVAFGAVGTSPRYCHCLIHRGANRGDADARPFRAHWLRVGLLVSGRGSSFADALAASEQQSSPVEAFVPSGGPRRSLARGRGLR